MNRRPTFDVFSLTMNVMKLAAIKQIAMVTNMANVMLAPLLCATSAYRS